MVVMEFFFLAQTAFVALLIWKSFGLASRASVSPTAAQFLVSSLKEDSLRHILAKLSKDEVHEKPHF